MSDAVPSNERKPKPVKLQNSLVDAGKRFLLLALIVYLMFITPLTWFQRSLIYFPRPTEPLLARQIGFSQPTFDITVKASDGLDLHGWVAITRSNGEPESGDLKQLLANDRPVVLYFPGNAGDRSMRMVQLTVLSALGANVVLVDYRGYADNSGKPSEQAFARDARSIWNFLTGELAVPARRIVIYGESIGGGTAVRLASDVCREGMEPGGLIIQSTFNSLVAAAQYHFPFIPASLLLVDRFPSDRRIASVACPILQIHGQRDLIVPFTLGQKLFDSAPEKSSCGIAKKQFVMPNTDHNDVYSGGDDFKGMQQELKSFLDQVAEFSHSDTNPSPPTKPLPIPSPDPLSLFDGPVVVAIAIVLIGVLFTWFIWRKPSVRQ